MQRFHHSNSFEVVGSLEDDSGRIGSHQVFYGLDGADTLATYVGSEYVLLVGGQGDDTYVAANHSAIIIYDSGGSDTLVATGLGVNYPTTFVATIEGKHLLAGDLQSGQQITVVNWLTPGNQIETITLGTGTYSLGEVVNFIQASPNFLGDLSASDLVALSMLPPGTTSADMQNLLDYVVGRESELVHQLANPAMPPAPEPTPQPPMPDAAPSTMGFDANFYLEKNVDVAAAGINPLEHFSLFGWREGRDPNQWFDTSWYLSQNQDVAAADINPLEHFSLFGWREGRDPNQWFDTSWYLEQNPDVAAAGMNPVEHYWLFGWQEGRISSPYFDGNAYLMFNQDVAAAGINPLEHWIAYGQFEGRESYASPGQMLDQIV